MKSKRRSMLQCQIILQLNTGPVDTVTELARLLEAERTSVSRSLNALNEQNITIQTDAGLELTESGREEAKLISITFGNTPKKLRKKADEFERIAATIPKEMLLPASMKSIVLPSPPLLDLQQQAAKALQSLDFLSGVQAHFPQAPAIAETFQNVVTPLLDAQESISSLWKQLLPALDISRIAGLMAPTNGAITALITDASIITQSQLFQAEFLNPAIAERGQLAGSFLRINQSYQHLISDYTHENIPENHSAASQAVQRVMLPTLTTAQYTRSVRAVYDIEMPLSTLQGESESGYEKTELEALLRKVSPRFVEMRQGTWAALKTRGPDYLRHAGTSQRALMEQLLKDLVPNEMLPDDIQNKEGPHIKPRTKLLGFTDTESEYADAMGKAMLQQYRMLNAYTHGNNDDEMKCRLILQTGEDFIQLLLFLVFSRRSD